MTYWPLAARIVLAALLCAFVPVWAEANDASAESAAGGLQLRKEPNVSMLKERLYIGKQVIHKDQGNSISEDDNRIVVEYEFLNESAKDITTEVAFPLPEFGYPWEDPIQDRRVQGFKVEVDGKAIPHETDVRANANGRDITNLLRESEIDIESFGGFKHDSEPRQDQVYQLPKKAQERLKSNSAIDDELYPRWTVAITHHWKQSFPAGKIVRIKHEYQAIPGFGLFGGDPLQIKDGCPDDKLLWSLKSALARDPKPKYGGYTHMEWVKYILTTANTWKTPIREFELIVERPPGQFVSFCWDGKVEKISQTQFRTTAYDFVPERELVVYFFSVGK